MHPEWGFSPGPIQHSGNTMAGHQLKIGFVPLIDAAPIIVARDRGFFDEEGLDVSLHRQVGWANIRDKLSFGHLDAAHALLGMPIASFLGRDSFIEPLVSVMGLGCGGNAITLRREIAEAGVQSASDLLTYMRSHPSRGTLMAGHVFASSTHHYLLRSWLASGGIDPDRDVKLCVIPPPQMTEHMRGGYLDVFCVGEPWNTLAARQRAGVMLLATADIIPRHPEKILAVSRRAADRIGGFGGSMMAALVRAILRGCMWCGESHGAQHGRELAGILCRPEYLNQPQELILQSLSLGADMGENRFQKRVRPHGWVPRSFSPEMTGGTFPNKMHAVWLMQEMIRWGHLHPEADIRHIAENCCDTAAYRMAATSVGVGCPGDDFMPMPLRNGRFVTLGDAHPQPSPHVRRFGKFPESALAAIPTGAPGSLA